MPSSPATRRHARRSLDIGAANKLRAADACRKALARAQESAPQRKHRLAGAQQSARRRRASLGAVRRNAAAREHGVQQRARRKSLHSRPRKTWSECELILVIPSLDRPDRLARCTLSFLHKYGVTTDMLLIFTEQVDKYAAVLARKEHLRLFTSCLRPGVRGVAQQRHHIISTVLRESKAKSRQILFLDDDIRGMREASSRDPRKSSAVAPTSFWWIVRRGFAMCRSKNARLWSVDTSGRWISRSSTRDDLGRCNGYFFGVIADAKLHAKTRCKIAMRFHTCDDVERSVRYFAVCGAVVRLRRFAVSTDPCRTTPGGIQSNFTSLEDRQEAQALAVRALAREFPKLIAENDDPAAELRCKFLKA